MTTFLSSQHERVWQLGRRYIAGLVPADATAIASALAGQSVAANIGWLTRVATDQHTAADNSRRYRRLAVSLAQQPVGTWLEVDLPHIGLELSVPVAVKQLRLIAAGLPAGRFIQVGAEDSDQTDSVLATVLAARRAGVPIRATVQANLHRSPDDVARLTEAGVPIRLVKGGFLEPAERALPSGAETDLAFVVLAWQIMGEGTGLTLATHDPRIQSMMPPEVPVEMLLGVRSEGVSSMAAEGRQVRLFVPFGTAWFDYLAKRVSDAEKAGVTL
ncbi:proline dehydrogenase [Actinocrispum wychmicini]|uniref:Proline dehydrogenase n=1 Tax=Actinocrispum wychmicini TaxID=1213861 RepID=A0A4R2K7L4_9PSEU|nr:proline dehydrogenase [Actinocrispum wychmicini]TCO62345.1 proline dehydrogenase [Actinocrispum wychmicini]